MPLYRIYPNFDSIRGMLPDDRSRFGDDWLNGLNNHYCRLGDIHYKATDSFGLDHRVEEYLPSRKALLSVIDAPNFDAAFEAVCELSDKQLYPECVGIYACDGHYVMGFDPNYYDHPWECGCTDDQPLTCACRKDKKCRYVHNCKVVYACNDTCYILTVLGYQPISLADYFKAGRIVAETMRFGQAEDIPYETR